MVDDVIWRAHRPPKQAVCQSLPFRHANARNAGLTSTFGHLGIGRVVAGVGVGSHAGEVHAGAQGGVATKDTVIDAARGCVRGVVAHVVGKAVIYGVDAILRRASTNGNAGGHVGDDQANALSRLKPEVSEEEANAARRRDLHALREHLGDPHTQADNRDEEEDDALDKHRSHRSLPRDGTGAAEAHNIVGEISVQAHAGGQGEGQVGEEAHASACDRSRQRSDGYELAPEIFHARVVLAIVEATGFGHTQCRAMSV